MNDPEIASLSCSHCDYVGNTHIRACEECGQYRCINCAEYEHSRTCMPGTIWWLTDDMSNGRWLFVDNPSRDGIPVGIVRVYTKFLDSAEARAMATALIQSADEFDSLPPPTPPEFSYTTSGVSFGSVPFPNWPPQP